jgi:hypothetical protein
MTQIFVFDNFINITKGIPLANITTASKLVDTNTYGVWTDNIPRDV